jgi:hypothetical protein
MFRILNNDMVEIIEDTKCIKNLESMALIFAGHERSLVEKLLKSLTFKYGSFDEYELEPFGYYKVYCCNGHVQGNLSDAPIFKLCRLLDSDLKRLELDMKKTLICFQNKGTILEATIKKYRKYFREDVKFGDILDFYDAINYYDKNDSRFDLYNAEIIYDGPKYVITMGGGILSELTTYLEIKEKGSELVNYDYKEWYIENDVKNRYDRALNSTQRPKIFEFEDLIRKYIVDNYEGIILPEVESNIESKFLNIHIFDNKEKFGDQLSARTCQEYYKCYLKQIYGSKILDLGGNVPNFDTQKAHIVVKTYIDEDEDHEGYYYSQTTKIFIYAPGRI